MAVRYDAKRGSWMFVIDLPPGPMGGAGRCSGAGSGPSKVAQRAEEQLAKQQFGGPTWPPTGRSRPS